MERREETYAGTRVRRFVAGQRRKGEGKTEREVDGLCER